MAEKVMIIGRVCYKNRGRDSGERAVIVGEIGKGDKVIIKEGWGKLQKCNILHLFPTVQVEDVQEVSVDELKRKATVEAEKKAVEKIKVSGHKAKEAGKKKAKKGDGNLLKTLLKKERK